MKHRPLPTDLSRRKATQVLASMGLITPLAPHAVSAEPGIVGMTAPEPRADFWIDGSGRPTRFSLAEQRGKWVHLKFWQSWCPGCHAHGFPALVKMAAAFAGEPRVVNVALQTVFEGFGSNGADKVRSTQLRYLLPIVFGHDPGNGPRAPAGGTMVRFRSGGTPWHVVVDPKGLVVFNGFSLNPDQAIEIIRAQLRKS
jgi:thiol-disulfide isomerase/thioredoxin